MLNRRRRTLKRTLALIGGLAVVISPLGAQAATPGSRLWTAKTAGYAGSQAVAPSPDGTKVFVAGTSTSGYLTVAYDIGTGEVVWSKTLGTNPDGGFTHLAVSPDGSKVFVTGISTGATTDWDYGTIAYDASNGTKLWFKRYDGASGPDWPNQIVLSPDGSALVVTGSVATGPDPDHTDFYTDFGTVAYDAATGAKLWSKIYNPAGDISGNANDVVITADGKAIVTGVSCCPDSSGYDAVTIAYDLATGQKLWLTRYSSPVSSAVAYALALSPNGRSVYVAGYTWSSVGADSDFATWALRTSTGTQRWLSTYNGPANGYDDARDVAVAPNGTVYVTGNSRSATADDFVTIAYEPSAGAKLWSKRYNGPASGPDDPVAIAVSPDGAGVFVTGRSHGLAGTGEWATIAYQATSGAVRWAKRLNGLTDEWDAPSSLAASPDSSAVYVTGHADLNEGATIAYAA